MEKLLNFMEKKLHWVPHLVIYKVHLIAAEDTAVTDDFYFLTFRAAERFVKCKENKMKCEGWRWEHTGGVNLWFM